MVLLRRYNEIVNDLVDCANVNRPELIVLDHPTTIVIGIQNVVKDLLLRVNDVAVSGVEEVVNLLDLELVLVCRGLKLDNEMFELCSGQWCRPELVVGLLLHVVEAQLAVSRCTAYLCISIELCKDRLHPADPEYVQERCLDVHLRIVILLIRLHLRWEDLRTLTIPTRGHASRITINDPAPRQRQ